MTKEEREKAIAHGKEQLEVFGGEHAEFIKLAIEVLEQAPCEDCVSREELKKWLDINFSFGGALRKLELFDRLDKELPSVTPIGVTVTDFANKCRECGKQKKGKWIPVSERLPKEFEFVNCTCRSLIDDRDDWVIETVYVPQPQNSPYSDWGNIPMLNSGKCEVIAWMHRDIPKPYQEEKE